MIRTTSVFHHQTTHFMCTVPYSAFRPIKLFQHTFLFRNNTCCVHAPIHTFTSFVHSCTPRLSLWMISAYAPPLPLTPLPCLPFLPPLKERYLTSLFKNLCLSPPPEGSIL